MRQCVTDLITPKTGILVNPTAESIAAGIRTILNSYNSFEPREWFTSRYGTDKANSDLKKGIESVLTNSGEALKLSDFNYYGGDPWTKHYYELVVPIDYANIKTR